MRIRVEKLERIRTLEDVVIDVKVSKMFTIENVHKDIDNAVIRALRDYIIANHGLKSDTYLVCEVDENDKYVRYIYSFDYWGGYVDFKHDEDIECLSDLAHNPLTDVEKLSLLMPAITNNQLTDYVVDMVQAKIRQKKTMIKR